MKTSPMLVITIGMLLCGSVSAQTPSAPPEWQSLKIQQTVDPVYPSHLLQVGVMNGKAQIAINTDSTGKLVQWLVVGYTQPEFANAALAAIKEWKYEPARLQGEPVGTTIDLAFQFSASGVVVMSAMPFDPIEARILAIKGEGFVYQPCSAHDLDQIPVPTVTVTPHYTKVLADRGLKGKVTVEYYIDETGAVRMPTVSANDNSILTALALDAVSQWKFTPPTSKGRNVLVKAMQVFDFKNGG
ncbi:MAG TPA: energy transducer TonB [Opitutaceae bacterium]|nr:energy transducer TonB [Opitutaceae bacterium]